MPRLIKRFSDGSILEYDRGNFDEWCVYLTRPRVNRYAPRDIQYFAALVQFSGKYGTDRIYGDFVQIYDKTGREVEASTLQFITSVSESYRDDLMEVDVLFSILYAGMIAEENKKNKVLGKRLKRLGLHQCLIEGMAPEQAVVFSKGKRAPELDRECKKRGF